MSSVVFKAAPPPEYTQNTSRPAAVAGGAAGVLCFVAVVGLNFFTFCKF